MESTGCINTDEHFCRIFTDMITALADSDDYPESFEAASRQIVTADYHEVILKCTALELAQMLHDTDGALPMHETVATFCLETYFDEYMKGNAEAACDLGTLYYTGRAGEQDYAKAVEYYTFAADNGVEAAQENLGYCYYYGRSVEVDYEKAFKYFLKGALKGYVRSLYKIGDMYKNGYYVEKDEKEAFRIYEHCLDIMDDDDIDLCGADVYMRVAEGLRKGIGVLQDFRLSLSFYQRAEAMFYDRLKAGDYMIKGNLETTIKAEEEVRKLLMAELNLA